MTEPGSLPSPAIREGLSWKLAAEFFRRHPDFGTLIEAHPGGGQYDCLGGCRDDQLSLVINRCGGISNLEKDSEQQIDADQVWLEGLREGGIGIILDKMSRLFELPVPSPLPRTSREALIYRVISVVMSSQLFDKRSWCCKNGQEDTSGFGNQEIRDQWFAAFPGAQTDRRRQDKDDFLGNPNYRFWFICRDETPVACLSKRGLLYSTDGSSTDLMSIYRDGATVEKLASRILENL